MRHRTFRPDEIAVRRFPTGVNVTKRVPTDAQATGRIPTDTISPSDAPLRTPLPPVVLVWKLSAARRSSLRGFPRLAR